MCIVILPHPTTENTALTTTLYHFSPMGPPRYYHAHYSDKHSFIVVLSILEAAEPQRNDKSAAINRAEINSLNFLYIGAFVPSGDERKD